MSTLGASLPPRRPHARRALLEALVATLLVAAILAATMSTFRRVDLVGFGTLCLVSLGFAAAYRGASAVAFRLGGRRAARTLAGRLLRESAVLAVAGLAGGEAGTRILAAAGWLRGDDLGPLRWTVLRIGFVALLSIRLVLLGYDRLRERLQSVELREERALRQAAQADLAALQARTDPHFLFNSLNTIAGLIEEDPGRAVTAVTRLAELYRQTIHCTRVERIELQEELAAARAYLEIQALRFGDGLVWSVDVDAALERTLVPPLVLRPLIENAVLHGASGSRPTHLRVEAKRSGESLVLTVRDDGPGPGRSSHHGSGTALADLRDRLALLFGRQAALEVGPAPGGGFRSVVTLPFRWEGMPPAASPTATNR